ncbi:hypothetical protein PVK06_019209 [Gossypium arboreum]|uniref:Uncharacterized protein n=1 Tax=Gossypium arboreum TaxID=29729 RepID=A0ABR0PJF2_GOSAR|nr:hypothetical protein PVK06_019209 [Gossypium arboreum]
MDIAIPKSGYCDIPSFWNPHFQVCLRPKCLYFIFDSRYRVDIVTHQDLCHDIAIGMLLYSHLKGYVATSSTYITILKAVSHFLYSTLYVATLDLPCGDIASSIGLKCFLMLSCTLTKLGYHDIQARVLRFSQQS